MYDQILNTTPTPVVGDGMTENVLGDSYPYVIVRVSDSGKTVWIKPLLVVDTETGHQILDRGDIAL